MEDVVEAELKLDEALRRYPVLVHKNFTLFRSDRVGTRKADR
jgi:hypothetical protein